MASVNFLSYDTSGVTWAASWSGTNVIGLTVELYEGFDLVKSQSYGFPAGTTSWSGGFSYGIQYNVQYGVWVYLYAEPWTLVDNGYNSFELQPPAPTKGSFIYVNGEWKKATPYIYTTKNGITKWWPATAKIYDGGQWK